jgi:methionine-rich copper-binding protein CopC
VIFAASLADTQAPSVISRSPLNGSSNVPTTSAVTATFSEAVDSTTVINNFQLKNGSTVVPATVTYDSATHVATLTPTTALAGSTTYTVTINGVKDLAGNVMAGSDTWSFTTVAVDTQAPTVISQSPAPDATGVATGSSVRATFSEPIDSTTYSFVLQGPGGSPISASVSYDSSSRTLTLMPTAALAASTSYTALLSGAKDLAGNLMAPVSWSFTTASTVVPTVVAESPAPNDLNVSLSTPVTATFNEPVVSTSLVFALRDPNNNLVATTFVYDSTTQTASWTPSSPLASQTTYTATLSAATDAAGNSLSAPVSWSFTTLDAQPPSIVNQSPAAGATGVALTTSITVTFSEPVQSSSISLLLRDPANQPVAGNLTYNESTRTATFTPSAPLAAQVTLTVSVSGVKDLAGNALANPLSWSFTTAGSTGTGPYSLFSTTAIPAVAADPDSSAVEVGVRFSSDLSGYITGVRFYKGSGNSGTHIGNLWSSSGTLMATATFSSESASGWQTVMFSSPVAIIADTTYVASYFAPSGHYSVSETYFENGLDNAPLHVPANGDGGSNGVYRYGSRSGFPSSGYMASNYWVDVLFSTVYIDNVAPSVIATTPASGSTNNALTTSLTAKFSESVQSSSISFVLRDPSNNIVPGVVSYDDSTKTATLKPSSALLANTTYTATVSDARDLAGNPMNGPVTWSFGSADTIAPTIISQSPAPDATGVTGKTVRVVFSEAMTSSSITTTTFQLLDSTNTIVAATVSYNATTRTATLTASGNLKAGSTYTVRVVGGASGVKDSAGNALAADVVWTFAAA